MIDTLLNFYNNTSQKTAARLHFFTSTTSVALYTLFSLGFFSWIFLPFVAVWDLSTAYFVIGGVNKDRYLRLPYPDVFYITHVVPGKASYLFLIIYLIFGGSYLWVTFFTLYIITYLTGAYAFFKLR